LQLDTYLALVDNVLMEVIDCHTHILSPEVIARREEYCRRDRWFGLLYSGPRARLATAEELVASMDEAGVDVSIAFGFAFADLGLCHESNVYVLEAGRLYPGRVIPFAVLNPRAGQAALLEARECLERGAQGIGELMPDGQGFELLDFALLDPLMDLARQFKVPVMVHVNELIGHSYAGKGTQGPYEAFQLATHYPENTLILAHWGGGLPFYELMPEVRKALGNVYYDTAASFYLYEDTIFRHVMDWAPHKVLLGTDYPLVTQRRYLRRLREIGLGEDALAKILGGNVRAVLRALQ
jgi:predicted TIM-barrel fold metal-dependent hydrolase